MLDRAQSGIVIQAPGDNRGMVVVLSLYSLLVTVCCDPDSRGCAFGLPDGLEKIEKIRDSGHDIWV